MNNNFPLISSTEPKRRALTTTAYFTTFIGLGMVGALLGPSLPYLANITHTSLSQISILFIARSLGYLVGSIFGGYLFDRVSGNTLMAVTLVGLFLTLGLTPVVSMLWILTFVLFLGGVSQGIVDVGGNTLIVWLHGKKVGPFMNALHMFYGVGTFLAPVVLAQSVLITGTINWGYWLIAAFVFFTAFQLTLLPKQVIPSNSKIGSEKLTNGLLVSLAALFLFCYSSFANIFGGWIFTYVTLLDLTNEANAAYLTSAFWGAFTVGRLMSIPIAMRVKPSKILLADILGCLFSTSLMILLPNSISAIWVGAAGLGLFAASLFPTTVSLVEQRIAITGNVTSRFVIGSALGAMIPPWIVGQVIERTAPQIMLYIVAVILLAGGVVYHFLSGETTPKSTGLPGTLG